jgi:hypothetical protein
VLQHDVYPLLKTPKDITQKSLEHTPERFQRRPLHPSKSLLRQKKVGEAVSTEFLETHDFLVVS